LLGQDGEAVKSFVENVGKFQRGENLVQASNGGSQQQPAAKQPAPRQSQDSYMTGKAPVKAKNAWQDKAKKQQQQGRGNKQQQPKKPTVVPAAKKPAAAAAPVKKPQPVVNKPPPAAVATKQPVEKKKVAAPPPKKSHPKKGKASHVCGCFGTVHKPLANCLYCGRVSCHKEGFDFCAFCGLMVEKVDVDAPTGGYVLVRYASSLSSLFEGLLFVHVNHLQRHSLVYQSFTITSLTQFLSLTQSQEQGLVAQGTVATVRSRFCPANGSVGRPRRLLRQRHVHLVDRR
jgi:hypothetical protein